MEEFKKYGFKSLNKGEIEELVSGNPKLTPLLQRYEGMGWVDILAELKADNPRKYILVSVGGENGYTAEHNFNYYCQLDEKSSYYTLEEILEQSKKKSWTEIISAENLGEVILQKCVEHPAE